MQIMMLLIVFAHFEDPIQFLMSFSVSRYFLLVALTCFIVFVQSSRWPFRGIYIAVRTDKTNCFGGLTWIPPSLKNDVCDNTLSLRNNPSLLNLVSILFSDCTSGRTVQEFNVDMITLYEYVLSIKAKEPNNRIVMNPLAYVHSNEEKEDLTSFLQHHYTLKSNFTGFNQNELCTDANNRPYLPITSVGACVFVQEETSHGFGNQTMMVKYKFQPTESREIAEMLRPFRKNTNFEEAFNTIFRRNYTSVSTSYMGDGCNLLMRIGMPSNRIIVCTYHPNKNYIFTNIEKNDFFCGHYQLYSSYFQTLDASKSVVSPRFKDFFIRIDWKDVRFTKECYSHVTVEPKITGNTDALLVNLVVRVRPFGDNGTLKLENVTRVPQAAKTALLRALREACPYTENSLTVPQTYTVQLASPSEEYFIHFAQGSASLSRLNVLKPCFFQQNTKNRDCAFYLPLVPGAKISTGGYQSVNATVVSTETNNCKIVVVYANEVCTAPKSLSLHRQHLALVCKCYTSFCDTPTSGLVLKANIIPKVCAVRGQPSEDDDYTTLPTTDDIACFYSITLLDGRPQFTLGFYNIEKAEIEGLPFENCYNETVPDKDRCIIKDGRQLCCCKANYGFSKPCNSVEVARNRHATSKLRASARCSTYLHLDDADRATCNYQSSAMRICVSVYSVTKVDSESTLQLTRETCELEKLDRPYDMALMRCHALRKTIVNATDEKCSTMLIEDSTPLTIDDAERRVVSCCPPEVYTTTRDKLKDFKFKLVSEFK